MRMKRRRQQLAVAQLAGQIVAGGYQRRSRDVRETRVARDGHFDVRIVGFVALADLQLIVICTVAATKNVLVTQYT